MTEHTEWTDWQQQRDLEAYQASAADEGDDVYPGATYWFWPPVSVSTCKPSTSYITSGYDLAQRDSLPTEYASDASAYTIHGADNDDERNLIRSAVMLVMGNTDLLAWALDAWNASSAYAGMIERLFFHKINFHITDSDVFTKGCPPTVTPVGGDHTFCNIKDVIAWESGNSITFCRTSFSWSHFMCLWRSTSRTCAILLVAVELVHELMHTSYKENVRLHNNLAIPCDPVYLVENSFAWALYHRYASLSGSTCDKMANFFGSPSSQDLGPDRSHASGSLLDCIVSVDDKTTTC
jgi:hypothetical protein